MSNYIPCPADTTNICLPEELNKLTEAIAKNAHEVWAKGRMAEGWTYGEVKNSDTKTTPCMLPYEDLPDSEKEYDRMTAMESIKLIVALGWTLVPPQE